MYIYLVFTALMIGEAHLQTTTISKVNSAPYKCGSNLVLKCQVSGSICCSNTRIWKKGNADLNVDANPKYTEELFPSSNYFTLTVHDLSDSDVGVEYGCLFSVSAVSTIKVDRSIYCIDCGGLCFLWSFIGGIVWFLISCLRVWGRARYSSSKLPVGSTGMSTIPGKHNIAGECSASSPQTPNLPSINKTNVFAETRTTMTKDLGEHKLNIKDQLESDTRGRIDINHQMVVKEKSGWACYNKQTFLKVTLTSLIPTMIIVSLIAVPIGYVVSPCIATERYDLIFIVLGFFVELLFFILVAYCFDCCLRANSISSGTGTKTRVSAEGNKKALHNSKPGNDTHGTSPTDPDSSNIT